MKPIRELKNPDIINVNGEKYQVINNTSLFYHADKHELEMVVELVKVGEKKTTPAYRLTYIDERSNSMHFFIFDKKAKAYKEQKINSLFV